MSKTYKKAHQSETALRGHKAKIKARGGEILDEEYTGWGKILKYKFPKKSR